MIDGPPIHLSADDFDDAWSLPAAPAERGYSIVYRPHEVNRCPGCGHAHWLVGRISAECAFCATAIPLSLAAAAPPVQA